MKTLFYAILLILVASVSSILSGPIDGNDELSSLSGIFYHSVKSLNPFYIELDGGAGRFGLRGRALDKLKDGTRILVRGEIRTHLYDNMSDPRPATMPMQWVIYMEVKEIKIIDRPFGNLIKKQDCPLQLTIKSDPEENEEPLQNEEAATVLGKQITYEDITPDIKLMEKKRAELSQEKFNEWLDRHRINKLRSIVFSALLEAYAREYKIEPTGEETKVFISKTRESKVEHQLEWEKEVKRFRKKLKSPYLSEIKKGQIKSRLEVTERFLENAEQMEKHVKEHSAETEKMEEQIAKHFVNAYKINKSLYAKYGGRVIFQQAGLEPLDAYRRFLEEQQRKGSFQIKDENLAKGFWEYFTTQKHTFFPEEESTVMMESPWWLLEEHLAQRMKNTEDIERLITMLKDGNIIIQDIAAKKLGKIGEPAVKALINALKQTRESERFPYILTEALSKIGKPAVKPLIIALKDENEKVRESAVMVLEKIEDESSIEPLVIALNDTDKRVRIRTAKALGKMGDKRAIEPLIAALKDGNKHVRTCTKIALEKITGKDLGQNPGKWQEWWQENKDSFGKTRKEESQL